MNENSIILQIPILIVMSVLSIAFFWSDEDISIKHKLFTGFAFPIIFLSYKFFGIYGMSALYAIYAIVFYRETEAGIIFSIFSPIIITIGSIISLSPFVLIFSIFKLFFSIL
jgi:hypothetical protein